MNLLARIIRSASSLWPYYVAVVFAAIASASLALISPFIIREATDTIVAAVQEGTTQGALKKVLWLAAGLLLADAAHGVIHNLGGYVGDVMVSRLRQVLSTRYFAKLLSLPQGYFDGQVTGTIIARLDRSLANVTEFIKSFANSFFSMLLQILAVLAITAYYYWPLTLMLVVLIPLSLWLTALTSARWQKYEEAKNHHIDLAHGRFSEVVGQIKVTKSFVAEARELLFFGKHYRAVVDETRPQAAWWHRMDTLRQVCVAVAFCGIYCVIFWRTLEGHLSIGDMVMLMQMVAMTRQPVFMLSWIVDTAQRAIAGSKDYFQVLEEEIEPTANPQLVAATSAADVPELSTEILPPLRPVPGAPVFSFDQVGFSYEEGKPVVSGISFAAQPGQKIALVGESGGGKSTLVNLLLGLYRPQTGSMQVAGRDISQLTAEQLRASVGVVFQDSYLFSGTIRDNIAYGKPGASNAEIEQVARRAGAHAFIKDFPDGYDTVIGERGLRLSGGQKQRVSVARAMLKDAPILILDEATSALDTKSERVVQAGLEELMKNKTTLIIAHRLSTIADVDTLITLDGGTIVEKGSPAELAVSGGIYSQLLALTQSSAREDREKLQRYGFIVKDPETTSG